ncbi:MAG: methyltransferase domain-containing protein [Burkholderiales bacterium]|nr:methyltransferase domain-containing protein [Burkholderiales bacterium]
MSAPQPTIDPIAFRDFERNVHDRLAESYHDAFTPVTSHAIAPLLDAVEPLAGARLLDVATGPGTIAARGTGRGATATGLDLSPSMVALARRLHPGVAFQEGEAERLPFADGAFDALVCAFGVGHLARPEMGFLEFARVLAPGGRIALAWWDEVERSRINGVFFDAVTALRLPPAPEVPPGPSTFRFSGDGALSAALAAVGFEQIHATVHATVHPVADAEALWQLARSSFARVSALIESLDATGQATLKAEIATRLAAYRTDRGYDIPISFRIATGVKPLT